MQPDPEADPKPTPKPNGTALRTNSPDAAGSAGCAAFTQMTRTRLPPDVMPSPEPGMFPLNRNSSAPAARTSDRPATDESPEEA